MKRAVKFNGWDWTELLQIFPEARRRRWPKDDCGCDDETAKAEWLREKLFASAPMGDESSTDARVMREVRRFLKKAASVSPHYDGAIYLAIANCGHDWTMVQWVTRNLECIWT